MEDRDRDRVWKTETETETDSLAKKGYSLLLVIGIKLTMQEVASRDFAKELSAVNNVTNTTKFGDAEQRGPGLLEVSRILGICALSGLKSTVKDG